MQDLTVGDLKKILSTLPDDMPVRGDYPVDGHDEKAGFDKICQVYKADDALGGWSHKALWLVVSEDVKDSGIGSSLEDELLWEAKWEKKND